MKTQVVAAREGRSPGCRRLGVGAPVLLGRMGVQAPHGAPVIPALTRRGGSASVLLPWWHPVHSGKEVQKVLTLCWASSDTGPAGSGKGASLPEGSGWKSWLPAWPLPAGLGGGLQLL